MRAELLPKIVFGLLLFGLITACGGGDGGGAAPADTTSQEQQALQVEMDNLFPYTLANQLFDITFVCGRTNSQLTYYFKFQSNGTYDVFITLDNGSDVTFTGTYTHQNNEIHMQSVNVILPMDERSNSITQAMGLVGAFTTPAMQCVIYGHDYNDINVEMHRHYKCPLINITAGTQDENAIEFTLPTGLPFNQSVRGAIFRQKDVHVVGLLNPNITRGYGIYRRIGDTYYANFGTQFNDVNLLKGSFINGELQLSVEQLEPTAGACNLQ